MMPSYTPKAPLTASPSNSGAGTTITAPAGTRGWYVTVAVQSALITFDGSAPTTTNGLTCPAGLYYFAVPSNLTVLAGTSGSIVNAIALT